MSRKLSMIFEAEMNTIGTTNILESIKVLAKKQNISSKVLLESVTHVLANMTQAIKSNSPLDVMSADSISAFLAGVEILAKGLPNAKDENRKAVALQILRTVNVGSDGKISTNASSIAVLGNRSEGIRNKYKNQVSEYLNGIKNGNKVDSMLAGTIKKLSYAIDQAMRSTNAKQF